jgi:hypothetical protein
VRVNCSHCKSIDTHKFFVFLATHSQIFELCVDRLIEIRIYDVKFQNSEYEVHQVGLKDYGSQNFSFLAFKGEAVGVVQILYHNGAATARDRHKFFFRSNHVFSYKKS